jgi:hypothetical protein
VSCKTTAQTVKANPFIQDHVGSSRQETGQAKHYAPHPASMTFPIQVLIGSRVHDSVLLHCASTDKGMCMLCLDTYRQAKGKITSRGTVQWRMRRHDCVRNEGNDNTLDQTMLIRYSLRDLTPDSYPTKARPQASRRYRPALFVQGTYVNVQHSACVRHVKGCLELQASSPEFRPHFRIPRPTKPIMFAIGQ